MKIFLVPNMEKIFTKKYLEEIIYILSDEELFIEKKLENALDEYPNLRFQNRENILKKVDFIISIGGDGTFIKVSKEAAIYDIPVLGVNSGHLGFLTSIETNELYLLKQIVNDNKNNGNKVSFEKRMLVNISIKRKGKELFSGDALNEVVLRNSEFSTLLEGELHCDGRFVNSYRADGIIFSTPTGSTAYNLSAGGPIITPSVDVVAVTPICSHSLFSRTIILSAKSEINFKIPTITQKNIMQYVEVHLDGDSSFKAQSFDDITITKSKIFARSVYLENRKFYDVLNLKMMGKL